MQNFEYQISFGRQLLGVQVFANLRQLQMRSERVLLAYRERHDLLFESSPQKVQNSRNSNVRRIGVEQFCIGIQVFGQWAESGSVQKGEFGARVSGRHQVDESVRQADVRARVEAVREFSGLVDERQVGPRVLLDGRRPVQPLSKLLVGRRSQRGLQLDGKRVQPCADERRDASVEAHLVEGRWHARLADHVAARVNHKPQVGEQRRQVDGRQLAGGVVDFADGCVEHVLVELLHRQLIACFRERSFVRLLRRALTCELRRD